MPSYGHNNVSQTLENENTEHRPNAFIGSNGKKNEFNGTFATQFPFNILKRRDSFNSITRTVFN